MPTIKGFDSRDKKKLKELFPIKEKTAKTDVVKEHIRDVDVTPKVKKKVIDEYKRKPKRY